MKRYNHFLSLVKYFLCIAVLLIQRISDIFSQTNSLKSIRSKINLTGKGWKVWMDKDASWKNDSLYLPNEIDLMSIPVNLPTCGWNGNGWGYLDHFIGDQAVPSKTTISTNSWEVSMDGIGFYPFESQYPQATSGAYFACHNDLVTTLGIITYDKGKIVLDSSFLIDYTQTFNDILFYNLLLKTTNSVSKNYCYRNE